MVTKQKRGSIRKDSSFEELSSIFVDMAERNGARRALERGFHRHVVVSGTRRSRPWSALRPARWPGTEVVVEAPFQLNYKLWFLAH
jgi:hypothetical protein